MILILSKHDFELTTEDVIDWLECLGGKWIRLNGEDLDSDNSFFCGCLTILSGTNSK